MFLLVSSFLPVATAAELTPALVLPTAVAVQAGSGQAALGALATGGDTPTLSGTLRGTVGITDRLAVNGALQLPGRGLLLGLRYDVVQTEHFRLAPFIVGAASYDLVTGANDPAHALGAGIGLALEGGGSVARFDLSLPLAFTGIDPIANPLYAPSMAASLGGTVHVARHHVVRVGIESLASPSLTYRYERDRWYLQAVASYSLVRTEPMLAAEIGLRF
jgi:hypothetical protein